MAQQLASDMYMATWLWHSELAGPEGKLFDAKMVDLKQLEEQGWVDSPVKIGLNVNNGLVANQTHPIRTAYEEGKIPGIELDSSGFGASMSTAEVEELLSANRRLQEQNDDLIRQKEDLSTKVRLMKEKEADEKLSGQRKAGVRFQKNDANVVMRNGEEIAKADVSASGTVTASPDPAPSKAASPPAKRTRKSTKKPVFKSDLETPKSEGVTKLDATKEVGTTHADGPPIQSMPPGKGGDVTAF